MKRVLTAAVALSLCLAMIGCSFTGTTDTQAGSQDTTQQEQNQTSAQTDGDAAQQGEDEQEPVEGLVDAKTGAAGPVILSDPYESGIHHAWLKIKGYERMEIEIYSDNAPKTAALFCKLVRKDYYDNMQLEGLMPDLYATLGDYSDKTDGKYTVEGEFEEAGFTNNTIGLKRGVIAMSRTPQKSGKASKAKGNSSSAKNSTSDAAHLYVFLTNASYLDGKYAGFAKITSGIATFDKICADVSANAKTTKKGKIKKLKSCPVIKYITLED